MNVLTLLTYIHTYIVKKGRIVWHNDILKLCTYAEKTAEHTFYMHIVVNYIFGYYAIGVDFAVTE